MEKYWDMGKTLVLVEGFNSQNFSQMAKNQEIFYHNFNIHKLAQRSQY